MSLVRFRPEITNIQSVTDKLSKEKTLYVCVCVCVCVCCLYLVDPVVESRHSGEDSGLSNVVAAKTRDEAGNAMNLPGTAAVLTVQGAARVSLDTHTHTQRVGGGSMFYSFGGVTSRLAEHKFENHNQNHCFTRDTRKIVMLIGS